MRKNDLVIYVEDRAPHVQSLKIGRIYKLASASLVELYKDEDGKSAYIENANIKMLPKTTYKYLLKYYNQNDLEDVFKDIANFCKKYKQDYLSKFSLGFLEHCDKINESLIPYLIEEQKLYKRDIFAIVNIFKTIEIEDFDKIYNNYLNFDKLTKLEQENILYIKTFLNNYSENQLNKDTYKIFKNFISENIDNKEQQNNYRWKFERVAGNTSGYIYDKKRDQSILIKSCVDLINETKNINIDLKYFENYIDIKYLTKPDLEYLKSNEINERGFTDIHFINGIGLHDNFDM